MAFQLNFNTVIETLGSDAAFRIANGARPPANYLFNQFLPEMSKNSYYVEAGNMTVRTTMAGLVGMDSPYPPGGMVEVSTFLEQSAKIAIESLLPEATLREIQQLVMRVAAVGGGTTNDAVQREVLNFLDKVIIQALMDRAEWLRAQALTTGTIDWTFNGKELSVNYGIPTDNMLTNRTGNDAYGGSASKFWADYIAAVQILRFNLRAVVTNSNTALEILNNSVNSIQVLQQSLGAMQWRKYQSISGTTIPSTDARELISITIHDEEAEIVDTTDPTQTITVPFMPDGKVLFIGNNNRSGYRVGQGSTDDPTQDLAIGYTHIAPTVEGGGTPGRWARLYTPEGRPWQLVGQGCMNLLPVIEAPAKVVVASTDMS